MGEIFTINTYWHIEHLIKKPDFRHVVCGTGAIARDMLKKLKLLELETDPILYSGADSSDGSVRHYERLREIENPKRCRFFVFYSYDEWYLNAPTLSVIKEQIGKMIPLTDHQQVVQWGVNQCITARGDEWAFNIFGNIQNSIGGDYFTTKGNADSEFTVNIFGNSTAADIFSNEEPSFGENLISELSEAGMNAKVVNYAQWNRLNEDQILQFLSEDIAEKPGLVLLQMSPFSAAGYKAYKAVNLLPTNDDDSYGNIASWMRSEYFNNFFGGGNFGVNFSTDVIESSVNQARVMKAISERSGLKFWACVFPRIEYLHEAISTAVSIRPAGYLKRTRERKDEFVKAASRYVTVKDFSDAFDGYDSIFPLLMDESHPTAKGYAAVAKRIAAEIIGNFPEFVHHETNHR